MCRNWFVRAFALAIAITPLSALCQEPTGVTGFIHAQGRQLVDDAGHPFMVRGIGLGNWLTPEGYMFKFTKARAPHEISAVFEALLGPKDAQEFWTKFHDLYVGEADIRFIAKAGFNTIRVPMHYGLFVAQHDPLGRDADQPIRFDGPGWALLDRLIGWCHQVGLKVILDLHAAPGGQTGVNHDDGTGFPLVFYVPRDKARTLALWQEIARRYHDETAVLGYELLNEPISTYNDENTLNPRLEPFYRDLTQAVRKIDPHHLVFLAGAQWDQNFAVFGRPFAPNLVYVFHEFWSNTDRDAIQPYINFSMINNVPVLLGEAGEYDDQWNRDFHALNERFGIGWCFWPYKNLDEQQSVVSIPKPAGWDKIAAAGSGQTPSFAPGEAKTILWAYLEAMRFKNLTINDGYVRSLGLGMGLTLGLSDVSPTKR